MDNRHSPSYELVHGPDRHPLHPLPPGTYDTYFILFLGLVRTLKVNAAVPKLGWTTCGTPFSKWSPSKLVELHFRLLYNSVSKPMFMWMRNPMITLNSPYDSWLTQNSKWLSIYWQYTHMHQTGTYESYAILSLGLNQT